MEDAFLSLNEVFSETTVLTDISGWEQAYAFYVTGQEGQGHPLLF